MKTLGFRSVEPRRRWLAAGAAWPALVWAGALRAQATAPVVIGWLNANRPDGSQTAFIEGMSALGMKLGVHYVLEARWADGQVDRLPGLARELAAQKPQIIVTIPSLSARAAAAAGPTTPIVLANGDPMSTGLVHSLARPGGMITGLSNVTGDLIQKLVELLVESLPKLQRVGLVADPTSPNHDASVAAARRAAEQLRIQTVVVDMAGPADIDPTMAQLAQDKVQALVMLPAVWSATYLPTIVGMALAQRWPVVGTLSATARAGGLLSYGPDRRALIRRSAYYVDRILKGAKPADLPIEQPTVFELVLNLKTAKTLGITIPPSVRLRATEVIE